MKGDVLILKFVRKLLFVSAMIGCMSVVAPMASQADSASSENVSDAFVAEDSSTFQDQNGLGLIETRAAGDYKFDSYLFMQYKPHTGGKIKPSADPVWQVKYVSGKKKQGWVYWTGKYKNAGRVGAYFQYKGTLK